MMFYGEQFKNIREVEDCWAWGDMPIILALRLWRQDDGGFKANLGYTVSLGPVLATIHIENISQKQQRETKNK